MANLALRGSLIGSYAKTAGLLIISSPTGYFEFDTFTCCHCGAAVVVDPKEWKDGFCTLCMKPICNHCESKGQCTPFEAKIVAMEKEEIRKRKARGIYGD